jgi:hypothetical protein
MHEQKTKIGSDNLKERAKSDFVLVDGQMILKMSLKATG